MRNNRKLKPEIKYYSPDLMEKLEYIRSYPLTILEASSGFGKTTALLYFSETRLPKSALVYRHEFVGNSVQGEWKQFCSFISHFDKDSSEKLMDVGVPDKNTMPYIKNILHKLSCDNETYLILDDMQEWKLENPCEFLSVLSEQGAKNLHIVVVSHPFSRNEHEKLIRSNRLWLLQEEDFAFSREDTNCYFRKVGLFLSKEQLDEVMKLTDGWIMAIYLQLDSLIRKGLFEQGGMENLIKKAFWDRLSEQEKKFLIEISIFPSFTLNHAEFFSGLSRKKIENQLREKYFFVRYDKKEHCYYMHTQLKNLLKSKLMLLPDDKLKEIYLKGGDAAFQSNDRINAFRFYYNAQAWEKILSMPFTSYQIADILDEVTITMVLDVMKNTPYEIKARYPKTMIPLAFVLFFWGLKKELMEYKDEILEIIQKGSFTEIEKNIMLGEMELLLSFLEYNRIGDMSIRHRKALELLGGPADLIDAKSGWTFGSPSVLYLFWRESGKLDEELEEMDECMPFYYQLTREHGRGAELIMRGEAHLHRGEIESTERLCYHGIIAAEDKKQIIIAQCGVFTLARLAIIKGDREMLENSRMTLKSMTSQCCEEKLCRNTYDLADGYLAILSGQEDRIEFWLAEGKINNRLLIMVMPFAYIVYGRILIQKKEYQKLLGISEYALEISSIFPNLLPQVYLKIYRAKAFYETKNLEKAISELNEAFKLALPDRVILSFSENYEDIKELLAYTTCSKEIERNIKILGRNMCKERKEENQENINLTFREREVFELLVKGMTNKEISEELYISYSVVKKHVSNILKKYGVSSREILKEENIKKGP